MTATPDGQVGFAPGALLGAEEPARRRREFDAQREIGRGLRESAA
jgi:hypothetical protein